MVARVVSGMSKPKHRSLAETEYLLRSRANARRLLAAIKKIEKSLARCRRRHARRARAPQKSAAEDSGRYKTTQPVPLRLQFVWRKDRSGVLLSDQPYR